MKVIRKLDSSGDSAVTFDPADAKATAEAKALFDRLKDEGRVPFAVNRADGQPDKKLGSFKEVENETVFIPLITGG
jgi:hypothetical protein